MPVSVLLRLTARLRPHAFRVLVVFLAMIGATSLMAYIPVVTGRVIDALPTEGGLTEAAWRAVWIGSGAILALSAVRGLLHYGQTALAGRVGQALLFELRNDVYRHMQYLPFSFFDRAQT